MEGRDENPNGRERIFEFSATPYRPWRTADDENGQLALETGLCKDETARPAAAPLGASRI